MVKTTDLSAEIIKALREYTDDVEDELQDAKDEVTKQAVQRLKLAGSFKSRSGSYKRGWKVKKNGNKGPYIIYNATDYQLTHLLEYGHATRGGGRTRAYPHIAPVEQWVVQEFESRVRRGISRGGK